MARYEGELFRRPPCCSGLYPGSSCVAAPTAMAWRVSDDVTDHRIRLSRAPAQAGGQASGGNGAVALLSNTLLRQLPGPYEGRPHDPQAVELTFGASLLPSGVHTGPAPVH